MPSRAFPAYAAATVAAAAATLAVLASAPLGPALGDPRLWLLAAMVAVGARLPIEVPRGDSRDRVVLSSTFAFATLLLFGPLPAVLLSVGGCALAGARDRVGLLKGAFDAAQDVLSLGAAAAVLAALGHPAPIGPVADALPAVFAAALASLVANHLLAGTAVALLRGRRVLRTLLEEIPFQVGTAGFLLALAPVAAAVAEVADALLPLMLVPAVAVHLGARHARLHARRALQDALTGLPNRQALQDRLDAAIAVADRGGPSVSLLLLDLDDFKAVNDTLGHAYGDALLRAVGTRLAAEAGVDDVLARLGGDEFAFVPASGCDAAAVELGERLVAVLDLPFALDGVLLDVRASVGVACYPNDGRTARELMQHADVALYCAKAAAASSVERYDAEQDDHSVDRLVLAGQLRRGLERGEIVLEYQPKFPVRGGRAEAVEALARWAHPALGRISPDGFIPLAERTGLIGALTRVVLGEALRQCAAWDAEGVALRVAVNVSPRSLLDRDLPHDISVLLATHGLAPGRLQLEVTETRAVPNRPATGHVLEDLRAMGVGVAIDDFGTGWSSLVQLQQLRVDEMKIDRSFVMNMADSPSDAAIVQSTIDLARNLGIRVTAEGVETAEVHRRLAEMGCDLAQGFHLCRPVSGERCLEAVLAGGTALGVVAEVWPVADGAAAPA